MQFHATILQSGKTATGIRVPDEVVEALRGGKRPPVKVTINGYSYRSTIAVMNGVFMVGVNAVNRAAAHVAGGDEVDVRIELDTAPRTVQVPKDLAAALRRDPASRKFFDRLSYSNRLWHVASIESAKTEETRKRRIEKSVAMLRAGRAR